jgi:hypothetical protein
MRQQRFLMSRDTSTVGGREKQKRIYVLGEARVILWEALLIPILYKRVLVIIILIWQ